MEEFRGRRLSQAPEDLAAAQSCLQYPDKTKIQYDP